jgi:hypothetical protein
MESNKNIYKDDIKFSDLAAVDPDFAKVQAIPLLSHPTPLWCLIVSHATSISYLK